MNAPPKDNTLKIVLTVVGGFVGLIVLGVLAIFALSFFAYQGAMMEAETARAQMLAANISQSAEIFKVQHGRAPSSLDELISPPKGMPILDEIPLDPWGRAFRLVGARVVSAGPDGTFATDDDVASASRTEH